MAVFTVTLVLISAGGIYRRISIVLSVLLSIILKYFSPH